MGSTIPSVTFPRATKRMPTLPTGAFYITFPASDLPLLHSRIRFDKNAFCRQRSAEAGVRGAVSFSVRVCRDLLLRGEREGDGQHEERLIDDLHGCCCWMKPTGLTGTTRSKSDARSKKRRAREQNETNSKTRDERAMKTIDDIMVAESQSCGEDDKTL